MNLLKLSNLQQFKVTWIGFLGEHLATAETVVKAQDVSGAVVKARDELEEKGWDLLELDDCVSVEPLH